MKNKVMKKFMATVAAVTVAAVMMTGCGSTETASTQEAAQPAATEEAQPAAVEAAPAEEEAAPAEAAISGTITMAGSTSMEKLANATAESFMAKYSDVTVTAEFTGRRDFLSGR